MAEPIILDVESEAEETIKESAKSKKGDKRKSEMWNHFVGVSDPKIPSKITHSLCNYCQTKLVYNSGNGTSSMIKHLGTCKKYPFNVDKKQKLISVYRPANSPCATISNWEFDQNDVRLVVAKMVIIDEQPFSCVEREGFRYFCSVAVPQFLVPSRFTVARDCKKLYVCERDELKKTFKGLNSRIALTTDCWTSNQNFNYMCLTSHFIDDNWKLHKRILNFQLMDSHKGKEIGKVVEACVLDWCIDHKLSCITVDNASSNDTDVGYLKEKLGEKLVLCGEFFHMRCAAHVLNLIVRDGLSTMKDALCNIRGAVRHVRSSPARAKTFDDCCKFEKLSFKGSVCLDVSTRWNSTYLMLESAIKFEKTFDRYFDDDNDFKGGIPKKEDWVKAKVLTNCLKQFYDATKRMSGSLYVTANLHFHEVMGILASLLEWKDGMDVELAVMSSHMRQKIDKYYGDLERTNVMVLIAIVLDPRCKLKFVKFALKKLHPLDIERVNEMHDHIYDVLKRLFHFYSSYLNSNDPKRNTSTMNEGTQGKGPVTNAPMTKFYVEFVDEEVNDFSGKCELEVYLEAPREKMEDPFDILSRWHVNCGTYKILAAMAKDVLAILVSTVSSESAFTTSGRVLDQFRSSLGPKTVEVLICAQDWLRGSHIGVDIEQYLADVEKYEEEFCDSEITQLEEIVGDNN